MTTNLFFTRGPRAPTVKGPWAPMKNPVEGNKERNQKRKNFPRQNLFPLFRLNLLFLSGSFPPLQKYARGLAKRSLHPGRSCLLTSSSAPWDPPVPGTPSPRTPGDQKEKKNNRSYNSIHEEKHWGPHGPPDFTNYESEPMNREDVLRSISPCPCKSVSLGENCE